MSNTYPLRQTATGGYAHGKTQKAAWGGFELLDRGSVLVDEGGSPDIRDPDLAALLQAEIGAANPAALRSFLNEFLPEFDIGSMEDMGEGGLAEILEFILS